MGGLASTGMRQRRTRRLVPRQVREPQMLEAAARLFAERGFNRVSMDEIAEASGITKPMLYAYFKSKEGLYVACVDRAARTLLATLNDAIDPLQPPERQLWSGLLAFFGFVDEHRSAWRTFLVEAGAHGSAAAAELRRHRRELSEALTELLMRAARGAGISADARPEVAIQARALIGSAEALSDWWVEQGEDAGSRELLALRLMNFAWMGFGDLLGGNLWLPEAPPGGPDRGPSERPPGARLPIDSSALVASLRRASDEELSAGLSSNRELILEEAFTRMGEHVRIEGFDEPATVLEWRITDPARDGTDRWQLIVGRGGAHVERDGTDQPSVALELGALDLLRLITGEKRGPELFLAGRLRIEGDLMLAARLPSLFHLPEAEA